VLAKLAVSCFVLVSLLAVSACGDASSKERLVHGADVVREFKAHGIVLQDSHLFDEKDAITAGYSATKPEIAEVTLFVAVCRSDDVARDLARPGRSPLAATATVRRRKNVVLYMAPDIDTASRRGAIQALTSL
jgi:hypothetical protein